MKLFYSQYYFMEDSINTVRKMDDSTNFRRNNIRNIRDRKWGLVVFWCSLLSIKLFKLKYRNNVTPNTMWSPRYLIMNFVLFYNITIITSSSYLKFLLNLFRYIHKHTRLRTHTHPHTHNILLCFIVCHRFSNRTFIIRSSVRSGVVNCTMH